MAKLKEFNLKDCYHLNGNILSSLSSMANIEKLTWEYRRIPTSPELTPITRMNNLKSLSLYIYPDTVHHLDLLLQLDGLKVLKVTSKTEKLNIDKFLTKMAEKRTLDELQIFNLLVSTNTFEALRLMNLKSLNMTRPKIKNLQSNARIVCQMICNTVSNVKNLTLSLCDQNADITFDDILTMIKKLKFLEKLNLYDVDCSYKSPSTGSDDLPTFFKNINEILQKCYRPKLKLMLPFYMEQESFGKDGRIKEEVQ